MLMPSHDPRLVEFMLANSQLGQVQRYREATQAELRYESLQYAELKDWDSDVRLRDKQPRIIIPLYREAIDQIERFVWGGHRFPQLSVPPTRTEDDPERLDEVGPRLQPEEAETLTRFLRALVQQGRLHRAIREASRRALVTSSCALVLFVRGGYLLCHVEPGKHCTPTFDPDNPRRPASLEIKYVFERDADTGHGFAASRLFWYRRVIDAERDAVFQEVPFVAGREPVWVEDPKQTVNHNLGFCPVVWARVLPNSTDAVDGRQVIDPALYPLLDEVNYTVSLRNRSVQYNCDPVNLRIGVDEDDRQPIVRSSKRTIDLPRDGDFRLVEATGKGAENAGVHLTDLEQRFRDACAYVKANPEITVGKLSGPVLEFLYAPMMALASDLRFDLGDEAFSGLVNLALRMCCVLLERGELVWVQGAAEAAKLMRAAQLGGVWLDFPVTIHWPPFFSPSIDERKIQVDATNAAKAGGLISASTATQAVADVFGIEDIEAEHEKIEEENALEYAGQNGAPGQQRGPLPEAGDADGGGGRPGGSAMDNSDEE